METTSTGELRRFDASHGPRNVGPRDGKAVELGTLGVRFMAWAEETGGGFSLAEHPIPPRGPCAPLHRHANEDEYSFVLEMISPGGGRLQSTSRRSAAQRLSSWRLESWSFRRTAETWASTVFAEIESWSAISL
jgi:hypothetical protein